MTSATSLQQNDEWCVVVNVRISHCHRLTIYTRFKNCCSDYLLQYTSIIYSYMYQMAAVIRLHAVYDSRQTTCFLLSSNVIFYFVTLLEAKKHVLCHCQTQHEDKWLLWFGYISFRASQWVVHLHWIHFSALHRTILIDILLICFKLFDVALITCVGQIFVPCSRKLILKNISYNVIQFTCYDYWISTIADLAASWSHWVWWSDHINTASLSWINFQIKSESWYGSLTFSSAHYAVVVSLSVCLSHAGKHILKL